MQRKTAARLNVSIRRSCVLYVPASRTDDAFISFISSIASSLPSVGGDVATPEELAALAAAKHLRTCF